MIGVVACKVQPRMMHAVVTPASDNAAQDDSTRGDEDSRRAKAGCSVLG